MNVSRRSFVAAMAAAFSGSVLAQNSTLVKPKVKWDYFTNLEAIRFRLDTPWRVGESTVATDGRILFSVLGYHDGDEPLEGIRPNVGVLPWEQFESCRWSSGGFETGPKSAASCPHCCGTGKRGTVRKELVESDWMEGYTTEKWQGDSDCPDCEGSGWIESGVNLVSANGSLFCPGYIARIESMGAFDWKTEKFDNKSKKLIDVLLFRNEFGRGFLCSRLP